MLSEQSIDASIPLVRAEHLVSYIDWLRKLGTPVERELRRARLPVLIEEMPEQSVCDRLSSVALFSDQDESWIEVPSRLLSQPITTRSIDAPEGASIGSAADESENRPGSGWIHDLSDALIPYLPSGHPPIDLAAEMAGTSVRSLQRRLNRMQTSYVELVERIRFDQAVRLMRDSNLNILDIALTLGYRDASNFSRAIRRISGVSPSQLRRALLH